MPSETPEASLLASRYPAATTEVENARSKACPRLPSRNPCSYGDAEERRRSRKGFSASARTQNIVPPKKLGRNWSERAPHTFIKLQHLRTIGRPGWRKEFLSSVRLIGTNDVLCRAATLRSAGLMLAAVCRAMLGGH